MIFKNSKVYDTLKWIASVGLPACFRSDLEYPVYKSDWSNTCSDYSVCLCFTRNQFYEVQAYF